MSSRQPGDDAGRRWSVVAVLAVAVAVVATAVVVSSRRTEPATAPSPGTEAPSAPRGPRETAEAFLTAWAAQAWDELDALSDGDEAVAVLSGWWRDLGVEAVTFTARDVRTGDTGAEVDFGAEVRLAGAPVWAFGSTMRLIDGGDAWVVEWSLAIVHPELQAGEHLDARQVWSPRAPITSFDGRPLVAAVPDVVVGVIPGRVLSPQGVAVAIAESTGADPEVVTSLLERTDLNLDWFYPITTVARHRYPEVRPALYPVPGVAFRLEPQRGPIEEPFADALLGRTGPITAELLDELGAPYEADSVVGRSGLEAAYEGTLAGDPVVEIVRVDASGAVSGVVVVLESTVPEPLRTTLSIDAQRAAEEALAASQLPAALVAIDVASGQVRAAASTPADGFNRAASGLYAPGSTFKIVVATALVERGMTVDDVVGCPAVTTVSGREFRNAARLPASLTLEEAFVRSCNTAFIELAQTLDPGVLDETAGRYGFDVEYDPGIAAAGGSFPEPQSEVEAAAAAIGQGRVLASPLHMASVAAAVASGSWRSPTLVSGLPFEVSSFDPSAVDAVRTMMTGVVQRGTGRAAAVEGLDVAGKTGTAQVGEGDTASTTAWFVGYAGELAFAVVVEGGESGGGAAAPLAASFLAGLDRTAAGGGVCVDAATGWPTFGGNPQRTGCSIAVAVTEPRIRWSTDVGIQAWLNGPIVVGNTIVVGTAGDVRTAPDARDGVVALDLRSGEEVWRFGTGNDVNGVASDGEVVVATGDEGAVWALDLETGEEVWAATYEVPVFTNPLFVDDIVVVGDAAGMVRALSVTDGAERWSARLDGPIRGGPASDGALVYAAGEFGEVGAFTTSGFRMWITRVSHPGVPAGARVTVLAAPTVVDDLVVVSIRSDAGLEGPALVALDKFVGAIRWQGADPAGTGSLRGSVRVSAALGGSDLVFSSSPAKGLAAVDAGNGSVEWATGLGVECEAQVSSPVVAGDLVYLARMEGSLHAVSVASGEELWNVALTIPGERSLGSGCTLEGAFAPGAAIQATPAVAADGTIVVGSMSGILYAIGGG